MSPPQWAPPPPGPASGHAQLGLPTPAGEQIFDWNQLFAPPQPQPWPISTDGAATGIVPLPMPMQPPAGAADAWRDLIATFGGGPSPESSTRSEHA